MDGTKTFCKQEGDFSSINVWWKNDMEYLPINVLHNPIVVYILMYVVGSKSFRLTYKSRAKWKMLWGIYIAIYGEVNVSVEKCVEIKGDYVEK